MLKFISKFLVGLFFFTLFAMGIGGHMAMNKYFSTLDSIESYIPSVLTDISKLGSGFEFLKTSRQKNAHNFLSQHLKDSFNYDEKYSTFFGKHKKWYVNKESFLKLKNDPELKTFKLSWMKELKNFDHWNLTEDENFQNLLLEMANKNALSRASVSEILPAFNLVKLRSQALIKLLQDFKTPNSALKDYLNIVRLVYSSGTQEANIHAMLMLKHLEVLNSFADMGWQLPSATQREILKKLSWAWNDIFKLSLLNRDKNSIIAKANYLNGVCPSVLNSANFLASKQDYFSNNLPFEFGLSEELVHARKIHKSYFKACGFKNLSLVYAQTKEGKNPWIMGNYLGSIYSTGAQYLNHSKIPYFRALSFAYNANVPTLVITRLYPGVRAK